MSKLEVVHTEQKQTNKASSQTSEKNHISKRLFTEAVGKQHASVNEAMDETRGGGGQDEKENEETTTQPTNTANTNSLKHSPEGSTEADTCL